MVNPVRLLKSLFPIYNFTIPYTLMQETISRAVSAKQYTVIYNKCN
jgi:hypothetical protein